MDMSRYWLAVTEHLLAWGLDRGRSCFMGADVDVHQPQFNLRLRER